MLRLQNSDLKIQFVALLIGAQYFFHLYSVCQRKSA